MKMFGALAHEIVGTPPEREEEEKELPEI